MLRTWGSAAGTEQLAAATVSLGIGHLHASRDARAVLVAHALGSCVGVVLYDPALRAGGMTHVQLPCAADGIDGGGPWAGADRALPELMGRLLSLGAHPARLWAAVAGGSAIFDGAGAFRIGEKNSRAVANWLHTARIPVAAHDVGGSTWRTLRLEVSTGRVLIQGPEGTKELYHGV